MHSLSSRASRKRSTKRSEVSEMGNKYIVIYTPTNSGDLAAETYDTYEEACGFLAISDDKAVMVKVETIEDPMVPSSTTVVELEWHT